MIALKQIDFLRCTFSSQPQSLLVDGIIVQSPAAECATGKLHCCHLVNDCGIKLVHKFPRQVPESWHRLQHFRSVVRPGKEKSTGVRT